VIKSPKTYCEAAVYLNSVCCPWDHQRGSIECIGEICCTWGKEVKKEKNRFSVCLTEDNRCPVCNGYCGNITGDNCQVELELIDPWGDS
jgi:hypothetical protein